jgi:protein-tyrosine phosphatase
MTSATTKPAPRRKSSRASGPSEIAPGVFVGGWNDAVKFTGARFCVLDEAPEDMPPATHIPIYDEKTDGAVRSNLERVAREMAAARSAGEPVLVFCGHGVRRSPLAGAWYLHRAEQLSLHDAYERIRAVRPKIETAEEWLGSLAAIEGA